MVYNPLSHAHRPSHAAGKLAFLLAALFYTESEAGMLTFLFLCIVLLLFKRRRIQQFFLQKRRYSVLILLIAVSIAIGLFAFLGSRSGSLWGRLKESLALEKTAPNPLWEILTENERVLFTYRNISFSVAFDNVDGEFYFTVQEYPHGMTGETTEIALIPSEGRDYYSLALEGLEDVTIRPGIINDTLPLFSIFLNGREWIFVRTEADGSGMRHPALLALLVFFG